jgi:hypothetical protein
MALLVAWPAELQAGGPCGPNPDAGACSTYKGGAHLADGGARHSDGVAIPVCLFGEGPPLSPLNICVGGGGQEGYPALTPGGSWSFVSDFVSPEGEYRFVGFMTHYLTSEPTGGATGRIPPFRASG